MDDNDLKNLFSQFSPTTMGSDGDFMSRLQRNLDTIETLRQQNARVQRRSKRAVVIASLAGFAAGILTTVAMPHIIELLATVDLPSVPVTANFDLSDCRGIAGWIITALFSSLTAVITYNNLCKPYVQSERYI